MINYSDRQMIAVLKPMMEENLGWTDATYGSVVSTFQFATAIACLGAGWVVDRIGLRWANPLSVGSFSVAAAAHALARTTSQFLLVRFALGATEALSTPAAIKAIAVWFAARQRSLALGFINAANSVGAIATPLLIPRVALAWGWRAAFVLLGGVGLLWTAAWLGVSRATDLRDSSLDRAPAGTRSGELWRAALRDPRTYALVGAKALADSVWWLLLFWTPDLLHRKFHLGMEALGVPVAAIYVAAIIGSLSGGFVSSRLVARGAPPVAARQAAMLGYAILAIPLLGVLGVPTLWGTVLLLGVGIAAHQGFSVNLFALITDVVPTARVGTVTSLGAFCGNLAGMAELWWLGQVLARGGSYAPFLNGSALVFLLALAWIYWLLPRVQPS